MIRRKDAGLSGNGGKFAARRAPEPDVHLKPAPTSRDAKIDQHLADLIQFSEKAADLVARGKSDFDSDDFLQLASEAIMHRIGEAVSRLDQDFRRDHPDVHWSEMKGMRNIVAHNYERVSHTIIWNTFENHLPDEIDKVRQIMRERADSRD